MGTNGPGYRVLRYASVRQNPGEGTGQRYRVAATVVAIWAARNLDPRFVDRKALASKSKGVYAEATPWDQSGRRA